MKTNFHDGAQLRSLMAAVINQAVDDLGSRNAEKVVDALFWLDGGDLPLWAEAAGLLESDAYKMLSNKNTRRFVWNRGEIDIVRMYAGLTFEEAKDLTARIKYAVINAFDEFQESRELGEPPTPPAPPR